MKSDGAVRGRDYILSILKGVMIAVIATLIGILVFAFVIKAFELSKAVLMPINQFIKVVSTFIGVMCALKRCDKGLMVGVVIGLLTSVVCYTVFSIMAAEWEFTYLTAIDMAASAVIGGVSGVIVLNLKKDK